MTDPLIPTPDQLAEMRSRNARAAFTGDVRLLTQINTEDIPTLLAAVEWLSSELANARDAITNPVGGLASKLKREQTHARHFQRAARADRSARWRAVRRYRTAEANAGRLAEQVRRARNLAASLRAHEADLLRRHDAAARDEEATALLSSAALTGDIARQLEEALAEDATGRQ
ncbi:hypothetical protein [Actinomadura sp. 3N407]|uniref:hypothetical protein n=1 Tax=Actinomadura sp. 3N407 TaxID=3457423 RepID=UPI003FCD4331